MKEYGVFNINDTSLSNLNIIAGMHERNLEHRICEISFIADSVASEINRMICDGMSLYDAFALLSEEFKLGDEYLPREDSLVSERAINSDMGFDKAIFSSLLCEKLRGKKIEISESLFLSESTPDESIVYVKNALADEAFDVFSQEFSDPRIVYADNFKQACFAVADGKAGYCILPFEEKGSVRIPSIAALVSELDLKIISITPVFGFEGNADVKYALVGRDFRIPEIDKGDDRYFEISIPKQFSISLCDLLRAAEYFNVGIYRIGTSVDISDSDKSTYSIVFKDGGDSFVNLLIYLTVFGCEYISVGIYKNIE